MSSREVNVDIRGDFQTPPDLARRIWDSLDVTDVKAVIEPTVGAGVFLEQAPESLAQAPWFCLDIHADHAAATRSIADRRGFTKVRVEHADAFQLSPDDFTELDTDSPVLCVGNPPWVTSAAQGRVGGRNLPAKSNDAFGLSGLDALTGKANFDIAEAILLRLLDALTVFKDVRLAFLVKRSVATKLARRLLGSAELLQFARIDAAQHFGVSVDAGLLSVRCRQPSRSLAPWMEISDAIGAPPSKKAGLRFGKFVEDLDAHENSAHHEADEPVPWRQGIKHDLARVLELRRHPDGLTNGLGESVDIEEEVLFPFYKGSDVANGRPPGRLFPLYQIDLSGPSPHLKAKWPRLAEYLDSHRELFLARRSSIYAGKDPFTLFGVGPYTVAPWKVVIPGLYRTTEFRVIGPSDSGRPPLVDDTCYLLPYLHEADARAVALHLNGEGPQQLVGALIDRNAKRPVTKGVLTRLAVPIAPTETPVAPQLSLDEAA